MTIYEKSATVHHTRAAVVIRYVVIALVAFAIAFSVAVVARPSPQPTTRCVHHADSSGGSTVCGKATR